MSILDDILATKRDEVIRARDRVSMAELEARARQRGAARPFAEALRRLPGQPVRVIAEYKRASPSAGVIRDDLEVETVAAAYQRGGAAAMSVLTDERYFRGQLGFLDRARAVCSAPILRKDFLIDPYQVVEARAAGADAVLLIARALPGEALRELAAAAREWQLATLVEVHDHEEAARAAELGAEVIGVNHRDLQTFTIDMSLTARVRAAVPAGTVLVGESGIRSAGDIAELGRAGADAVLIGESLMRAPEPGTLLGTFTGVVP